MKATNHVARVVPHEIVGEVFPGESHILFLYVSWSEAFYSSERYLITLTPIPIPFLLSPPTCPKQKVEIKNTLMDK